MQRSFLRHNVCSTVPVSSSTERQSFGGLVLKPTEFASLKPSRSTTLKTKTQAKTYKLDFVTGALEQHFVLCISGFSGATDSTGAVYNGSGHCNVS